MLIVVNQSGDFCYFDVKYRVSTIYILVQEYTLFSSSYVVI